MLTVPSISAAMRFLHARGAPAVPQSLVKAADAGGDAFQDLVLYFLEAWQRTTQAIYDISSPKIREGKSKHTASVIFFHGLGDTGEGWSQLMSPLSLEMPHVKFLFPTASEIAVTVNCGYKMPAWYDMEGLTDRMLEGAEHIEHSVTLAHALMYIEAKRLGDTSRIVLGGFSQGGAVALLAGHTYDKKINSLAVMSTYLVGRKLWLQHWNDANKRTPLWMAHGDCDPQIPAPVAKNSFDELCKLKGDVDRQSPSDVCSFKVFQNVAHAVSPAELRSFALFLQQNIPSTQSGDADSPEVKQQ